MKPITLNKDAKIYVAGHAGLVGSAIVRRLKQLGYHNIITRSRSELDLVNQAAVHAFMREIKPGYIFLAAAKVGGIVANNTYPADFIYQNLLIESNLIHAAYESGVKRMLFLGSSCIYPKECPQPMREDHLLTGPLEATNEPYALAKIAGIKLCEAYNRQYGTEYVAAMPTNLYGENDNFDLQNSHVLPALLRKMHEAKERGEDRVVVWGTGTPRREFLHVDDLADACCFLMSHPENDGVFNVGSGQEVTIRQLAELIRDVVGYTGDVHFDIHKPDGTLRKLLDVTRLTNLGWRAQIHLRDGIARTYEWYLGNYQKARLVVS